MLNFIFIYNNNKDFVISITNNQKFSIFDIFQQNVENNKVFSKVLYNISFQIIYLFTKQGTPF